MTTTETSTAPSASSSTASDERADLLEVLATHRAFLRQTVTRLPHDALATHSTVSQLSLGGLLKHVTRTEAQWARFVVEGPVVFDFTSAAGHTELREDFRVDPADTVESLLAAYAAAAATTDELVRTLPDLDASQPLPEAPWFPPGAAWSARRVLLHIVAETAQHAGHADIIRESIDGARTMAPAD